MTEFTAGDFENNTSKTVTILATEGRVNFSSCCQLEREILEEDSLTLWEFYGYTVVIPIICLVGIISNSLSLIVMSKVNFKESLYVYLKGKFRFLLLYSPTKIHIISEQTKSESSSQ